MPGAGLGPGPATASGPNGNAKASRMIEEQRGDEPDWDSPLQFNLTPGMLIHALMAMATAVHTGWESCIEDGLVVSDLVAMDDGAGTSIRLAEQEFYEDNNPDSVCSSWRRAMSCRTPFRWSGTSCCCLPWSWSSWHRSS